MTEKASRGTKIDLIRWQLTRDGWRHEVFRAIYISRDRSRWTLRMTANGPDFHLSRSEWHPYSE